MWELKIAENVLTISNFDGKKLRKNGKSVLTK
jgi:hypothetical protein